MREGGDLPNWGKASAGESCLQMTARRNPGLLNKGNWGVGRRSSPRCFVCNGTFESRPEDIREVRLTPLSPCEASTVAVKAWGCGDSKSAPEILALTFKRHTTARMASTRRTTATLRFNWSALFHSTRTLLIDYNSLPRRGVSVTMTAGLAQPLRPTKTSWSRVLRGRRKSKMFFWA